MKKTFLFISALFAFMFSQAQDCKGHLYMTANAKIVMTIYDKKGAPSAIQTTHVTDVKNNGGAYEATVTTAMTDEKGKAISQGKGTYRCADGVFSADMKMLMPQEQMGKMNSGEATFEPVYLEYPSALSVGQTLKDAEFNMTMQSGVSSSITFKEENRKVAAKESVTSPAGTWEAYVITYDGSMKTKMAGIGLPTFSFAVKEWFVPGIGVVKTETYSKNGKLGGSTLITSITK